MQLDNLTVNAPLVILCVMNLCVVVIFLVATCNRRYLFENSEYDQFNSELMDLDSNELFCDQTVEEMWQCFHSSYMHIVNY